MKYPMIENITVSHDMVTEFKGYNRNLIIGENEFNDMKNMTSDDFPSLSPRKERGIVKELENPSAIIAKDALCYIDGKDVYINDYRIDNFVDDTALPKQLVSMGAYLIIFPDAKYINTQAFDTDRGALGAKFNTVGKTDFSICDISGSKYSAAIGGNYPENPENGEYFLNTEEKGLYRYSETNSMWVSVPVVYIKIESENIGVNFAKYDAVKISGIKNGELEPINEKTSVIYEKGDDYIVVVGIMNNAVSLTQEEAVTVEREIPKFDYVVESQNRLWGCFYGQKDGKPLNEIYASKLGDPKNFNCFMGLSTDSYTVSLGSDGEFTGAATHLGYPIFFKENCFHKIYGAMPSAYQVQTTNARGVQKGSFRSICTVNETLFYKSGKCVCAYDGSLPVSVSEALGNVFYKNAAAGTLGNKYYISMQDSADRWHMFVCDTDKGLWHREDETQVTAFCTCDGDLFYIDGENNTLKTVNGSVGDKEGFFEWYAESGLMGYSYPDRKYISRLNIRMILSAGASVSLFIDYDSENRWQNKGTVYGKDLNSFNFPVIPRRCDHFRIKLSGRGRAKILSVSKTLEQGSDV